MAAAATGWVLPLGGGRFSLTPTTSLVLLLNLIDAAMTVVVIQLGFASEANPVMRFFYEISPLAFVGAKVALVSTGLLILAAHSQLKMAKICLTLAVGTYLLVDGWHLVVLATAR